MKTILLLVALVASLVTAVPLNPEFAMESDSNGHLKLVDLNADPVEPESFFDPLGDMFFVIYTRANPTNGETFRIGDDEAVLNSNFNPANPTRFTIHGWSGSVNSEVNTLLRDAYLTLGEFNVIAVDWSVGASTTLYQTARNRVAAVGAVTAQAVQMLQRLHSADISTVSVIGHHLGGHIAGFAGKNLYGELGSVVALDAAMNLFDINTPSERVAVGDARYVESIHTNTGQNGFDQPLGVASFYPNFGNRQPGCGIDITGNCAHSRANVFFAESITTTRHFWSRQCSAYKDILMEQCTAAGVDRKMGGEPVDNLAAGIYWTATNSAAPFATGIV